MHDDLKQFLFDYVESYEELGVLVWFHQHQDAHATARDISEASGLPAEPVTEALEALQSRGLLSRSTRNPAAFCYSASADGLRDAVTRLMQLYETNAMEVVSYMTSNAIERVRTAGMRMFAECFRIGGPKSRG